MRSRCVLLLLALAGCADLLNLDETPGDPADDRDDAAPASSSGEPNASSSGEPGSSSSSSSTSSSSSSSGASGTSSSSGATASSSGEIPDDGGVRYADLAYAAWPLPPSGLLAEHYAATDEVVYDQTTGLTWQRHPPATRYLYGGAKEYCESLALGGFDDWRLPYRMELVSIVNMTGGPAPLVQSTAFSDTPAMAFWSDSYAAAIATIIPQSWVVNFANAGVYAYSRDDDPSHTPIAVRCVRGIEPQIPKPQHWTVQTRTVTDNETGLIWQRTPASGFGTLAEAVLLCQDLNLDGQTGFRVPNLRELLSLIDETATSYGVDRTAFNVNATGRFWTTTLHVNDPNKRMLVDVSYGGSTNVGVATEEAAGVRCVKSPPSL